MKFSALLLVAAGLTGPLLVSSSALAASNCDRGCLRKSADTFLAALVKHDPAKAGLAGNFRYTENAKDVAAGEGLWKSAVKLGQFHRLYLDPVQSAVGFFGLIDEGTEFPAITSLRLKIVDGKIAEAEAVIGRKGEALYDVNTLLANLPTDEPLARKLRSTREQMIKAADSYFDGAQNHDAAGVLQKPGCDRFENGVKMTNRTTATPGVGGPIPGPLDCAATLPGMKQIYAVVNRRYPVVDEEAGVVMGTAIFNRPPEGAKRADGTFWPRLLLTEFFPVEQGKFTAIYAAMTYFPQGYAGDSGWQ